MIRASFTKIADERGAFSRENRRYTQGTVIDVDTVNFTATVDVADTLPDGTTQYLFGVPFVPHAQPSPKDIVSLGYSTSSPMSVYIVGVRLSGDNSTASVKVVTSVADSGQPQLTGDVVLAAGSGVTLSQSAQTITIAASAGAPHALLDGSVDSDTVAHTPVQGDVIVANSTPAWAALAKGTNGQVLQIVSGAPAWGATPAGPAHALLDGSQDNDTAAATVHTGDLVYGSSTPLWDRLPIGISGQYLKVVSGKPAWSTGISATHNLLDGSIDQDTAAHSPVKGDLVYADGTPQWNGLAVGSSGQVLGVSGGVPAWQNAGQRNVAITSAAGGTYTVGATDDVVLVYSETNAWTVALPNPTTCRGRTITVLDAYQGSSTGCTLSTATGVIIGPLGHNAATYGMGNSGSSRNAAVLVSDGSNWQVVSFTTNN